MKRYFDADVYVISLFTTFGGIFLVLGLVGVGLFDVPESGVETFVFGILGTLGLMGALALAVETGEEV